MRIFLLSLMLLASRNTWAQPSLKSMKRLPDTGQTTSYTGLYGEDSDYQINTPYFTNNPDGTAIDTVTGLMWQRVDGGEMRFEDALIYVDTLQLGGYTDWRLPTAKESFSILQLDKINPALDVQVFPNTNAEYWWTSELQYNNADKIWVTNAGGGIGPHAKTETISAGGNKRFQVRAVRNVSVPEEIARYVDNSNGTVKDNFTGLVWQKLPAADTLSWEQALVYAENLSLGGFDDWRLPNLKELQSINDETRNAPSVDITAFPSLLSSRYWTSTTQKSPGGANAWFMDFQNYGIASYFNKNKGYPVICVRGPVSTLSSVFGPDAHAIQLFPNPVSAILQVQTGAPVVWRIEDIAGRVWLQGTSIGSNFSVDVQCLPSGLYLIGLLERNGWDTSRFLVFH